MASSIELAAEYLRVESPSAEVQGHGPIERTFVPGKRHVKITRLEPVGHYAVRIVFDDRTIRGSSPGPIFWNSAVITRTNGRPIWAASSPRASSRE